MKGAQFRGIHREGQLVLQLLTARLFLAQRRQLVTNLVLPLAPPDGGLHGADHRTRRRGPLQ